MSDELMTDTRPMSNVYSAAILLMIRYEYLAIDFIAIECDYDTWGKSRMCNQNDDEDHQRESVENCHIVEHLFRAPLSLTLSHLISLPFYLSFFMFASRQWVREESA